MVGIEGQAGDEENGDGDRAIAGLPAHEFRRIVQAIREEFGLGAFEARAVVKTVLAMARQVEPVVTDAMVDSAASVIGSNFGQGAPAEERFIRATALQALRAALD